MTTGIPPPRPSANGAGHDGQTPAARPGGEGAGLNVAIRLATDQDTDRLLDLQTALDHETTFMLMEPGERQRHTDLPGRSYRVVAVDDERLVGHVSVTVQPYARTRHRGHIVMGIRASRTGQALGRLLLQNAISHARDHGLTRLELTVMIHNRAALALYTHCGFQVEGLRRGSVIIDG